MLLTIVVGGRGFCRGVKALHDNWGGLHARPNLQGDPRG